MPCQETLCQVLLSISNRVSCLLLIAFLMLYHRHVTPNIHQPSSAKIEKKVRINTMMYKFTLSDWREIPVTMHMSRRPTVPMLLFHRLDNMCAFLKPFTCSVHGTCDYHNINIRLKVATYFSNDVIQAKW